MQHVILSHTPFPFTVEKRRANKDAAAAMPPPLLRALIEVCALYAGVEAKQRWLRRFRPLKKELPASVFNFSLTMEAAEAEASQIPVQTCTLVLASSGACFFHLSSSRGRLKYDCTAPSRGREGSGVHRVLAP